MQDDPFFKDRSAGLIDFCMLMLPMVGLLREIVGTSTGHSGSGSRQGGGRGVIARGWTCLRLSGSARTTRGRPLRDSVVSFHLVAIHLGRRQFHPTKLGPVLWTDLRFPELIPSRADTLNQPVPHPNCKRFLSESARSRVAILVERPVAAATATQRLSGLRTSAKQY
jgi:hypothetical protein